MKKVLITGAGSGLGLGSALGLAKAGHDVFATVRRADQVAELQATVAKLNPVNTARVFMAFQLSCKE